MPWETENVRAAVFAPDVGAIGLQSWQALTGSQPAQVITRSAEGITQEAGVFNAYNLVISRSRTRADLFLLPQIQPLSAPPTTAYNIGPPGPALADLSDLLTRWISPQHEIQRVAVGALIGENADTIVASAQKLIALIPSFGPGERPVTDFSAQLNRPRPSRAVGNIQINRLCTWRSILMQMVPQAAGLLPAMPVVGPQQIRSQVDIDINTAVDGPPIPGDRVSDLVAEMIELVIDVAERGDRA